MALADDVQSRIAAQRLKELTNDGSPTASSINLTILTNAASDIQADFELLSNENYNSTNPVHVAICVPAVMSKLYEYQGKISPLATESQTVFIAKCQRIREVDTGKPAVGDLRKNITFKSAYFTDLTPLASNDSPERDNS